ncbi:MAG: hypothetical protein CTY10_07990, partial [Methylotenera sp.]
MRKKLGIFNQEEEDIKLAEDLLMLMQKNKSDFTNTFRALAQESIESSAPYQEAGFKNWLMLWKARLSRQKETFADSIVLMQSVNPAVIPRNHLVEEALDAAVNNSDMTPLHSLLSVLSNPYAALDHSSKYIQAPALLFDQQYKTFCGT